MSCNLSTFSNYLLHSTTGIDLEQNQPESRRKQSLNSYMFEQRNFIYIKCLRN